MALAAQFGSRSLEQFTFIGAVRLMAGGAGTIGDRSVGVTFLEPCFGLRMAAIADVVHSVLEHAGHIGAMGIMTGTAFTTGKGRMDSLVFHGIFRPGMAGIAQLRILGRQQPLVFGSVVRVAG